jgi:hypothetical protein
MPDTRPAPVSRLLVALGAAILIPALAGGPAGAAIGVGPAAATTAATARWLRRPHLRGRPGPPQPT